MMKKYILLAMILFSCTKKDISYEYPDNLDYSIKSRARKFFSGSDLVVYDGGKKNSEKKLG